MGIPVKSLKRLTAGFAKLVLGAYVGAPVKVLGGELIDLVKDQIPDEGDQWETARRFDDIAARIVRRVVSTLDEELEQNADLDTELVAVTVHRPV
jgi:hypothetical protein